MTNELTMEELLRQQDEALDSVKVGENVTGTVSKIENDRVVLSLDCGFDGLINTVELNLPKGKNISDVYNVGDEITAVIRKVSQKDATILLSKLALDKEEDIKELEKAFEDKKIITVSVVKNIERGVFASYKSQDLFIPISQLDTKFVTNTSEYVGCNLEVYIKEMDKKKNRMVASHRDVLQERLDKERAERNARIKAEREAERARVKSEREAEKARVKAEKEELFDSLEVGQRKDGVVTKIVPYGAFVNIGGIEGLLHRNNLSWKRVETVEEMVTEGQEVQVYIIDIDKDTRKFGVALKDINNDPWEIVSKEVNFDDIITGKVVRIIEKGAFVEIREAVEAFLPISELSEERVMRVNSIVNIGDEVTVRVIEFKPRTKRFVVSIKEVTREPEEDYSEYLEVEDSLGSLGELFKDKFKGLQK